MQIKEGLRDIESVQLTRKSLQAKRMITALIAFALWLVDLNLKGFATERQIKINSRQKRSPSPAIFFGRIECRYVSFELAPAI